MVSLGGFVVFWGWVFVLTTLAVWLGKKELPDKAVKDDPRSYALVPSSDAEERGEAQAKAKGEEAGEEEKDLGVAGTYRAMWTVLNKPAVLALCVLLLTSKVGFAAADALAGLKLQERGLRKEALAAMGVVVAPVALVVPALVAKYTHGERPMDVFLAAFPHRLGVGLLLAGLVWAVPGQLTDGTASTGLYAAMVLCFVAHQAPAPARPCCSPLPPVLLSSRSRYLAYIRALLRSCSFATCPPAASPARSLCL
jgi:MFS transporter, PAT family, solute carrier family 33 (acetyl-CoA transportor), member 1